MNEPTQISNVKVNVPDVDEALSKLFQHLKELQVAVLNNEDWPHLEGLFNLVGALAIRTFRREEEAMDLCRDRGALAHRSAHQKFLKSFSELRRQCEHDGPTVALAQDIRSHCLDWFTDHHRLMNASLGRVVKDIVEKSRAWHESSGIGQNSSGFPA